MTTPDESCPWSSIDDLLAKVDDRYSGFDQAHKLLAAEVRRLRDLGIDEVDRHEATKAKLAAIESLPNKWLDDVAYQRESVTQCAIDVENALRGEP